MVPGDQPGVGPARTAARKRPSPFVGGGLLQWWPTVGYCTLHTSTMFVGALWLAVGYYKPQAARGQRATVVMSSRFDE